MSFASVDSPLYVLTAVTTVSQQITIEAAYMDMFLKPKVIVDNVGGSTPLAVYTSNAPVTAVFPTSSSTAVLCAVVPPGFCQTFDLNKTHKYVSCIRASGTADVYVKLADGE